MYKALRLVTVYSIAAMLLAGCSPEMGSRVTQIFTVLFLLMGVGLSISAVSGLGESGIAVVLALIFLAVGLWMLNSWWPFFNL